jgi:hypothetical protein
MAEGVDDLFKLISELLRALSETPARLDPASRSAKRLRGSVEQLIPRLRELEDHLDPIERPDFVFDPSNPKILGKLIGQTLIERERKPLQSVPKFYGSGVYALYYRGGFEAYAPIRGTETPIYVGKADPRTPDAKSYVEQGPKLSARLAEHAKSIRAASTTLKVEDFECRFLVVQSGWQRSAEDYLLNLFTPIWNQKKICYGFGKHGDDPDTRRNTRSPWDTLHPGRRWATRPGNKPNPLSIEKIMERIAEHYRQYPPQR